MKNIDKLFVIEVKIQHTSVGGGGGGTNNAEKIAQITLRTNKKEAQIKLRCQ